ncbi:MAG: hypothetical protein CO141_02545 [Candidatus Moranbacteria bacterium CG_4_9_14_3_um_filter_42_9]|nr:MAG: hypothetical protein CO141_02545 [Candidatus Moranbacteria bacterium CG_4_9_14_3_um_filter_42_9]
MYFLDLIGTFAFAVAGAFQAREKNLNIFAVTLMGIVTAVGGGTFRDLVIGRTPLFYLEDQNYLLLSILGGVATYFIPHFFKRGFSFFRFLDSLGLAAFAIIGISVTTSHLFQGNPHGIIALIVSVIMGTITGVGGGIIRNALMGNLPSVFNQESTYIPASFLGSLVFYVLMFLDVNMAIFVSMVATLSVREIVAPHGIYKKVFKKEARLDLSY